MWHALQQNCMPSLATTPVLASSALSRHSHLQQQAAQAARRRPGAAGGDDEEQPEPEGREERDEKVRGARARCRRTPPAAADHRTADGLASLTVAMLLLCIALSLSACRPRTGSMKRTQLMMTWTWARARRRTQSAPSASAHLALPLTHAAAAAAAAADDDISIGPATLPLKHARPCTPPGAQGRGQRQRRGGRGRRAAAGEGQEAHPPHDAGHRCFSGEGGALLV